MCKCHCLASQTWIGGRDPDDAVVALEPQSGPDVVRGSIMIPKGVSSGVMY